MTSPTIIEQRLGTTPWLVARGERLAAFRALGEHARDHIGMTLATIPDLAILRRRIGDRAVAHRHAAMVDATRRQQPREWAELSALAAGAGVSFDDLLLLNLRGDLGPDDGTGCSDIGYIGHGVGFVAHNEDGAAAQAGRCLLLTLTINGDVPVTCWWCPGFVPANTFVITGNGLTWGIDHIAVRQPAAAPGRHFVARAAQHKTTPADVVRHLTTRHSAGGFTYTIGRIGHPEVTVVETAATHSHVRTGRGQHGRDRRGGRPATTGQRAGGIRNASTRRPGPPTPPLPPSAARVVLDLDQPGPVGGCSVSSRPLLATAATLLVVLAGCTTPTRGDPISGQAASSRPETTERTSPRTTGTSAPDAEGGLTNLKPCDLLDADERARLGLGGGAEDTIGSARVFSWRHEGPTSRESYLVGVGLSGHCGVALIVSATSRVDVGVTGGDEVLGCEFPIQLATLIEPKLTRGAARAGQRPADTLDPRPAWPPR